MPHDFILLLRNLLFKKKANVRAIEAFILYVDLIILMEHESLRTFNLGLYLRVVWALLLL